MPKSSGGSTTGSSKAKAVTGIKKAQHSFGDKLRAHKIDQNNFVEIGCTAKVPAKVLTDILENPDPTDPVMQEHFDKLRKKIDTIRRRKNPSPKLVKNSAAEIYGEA